MAFNFVFEDLAGIVVPVLVRNDDGTGLKTIVRWTKLSARCLVTKGGTVSARNGKLTPRSLRFCR